MAIKLTNPLDVGASDSNSPYTHIIISDIIVSVKSKIIQLTLEYGIVKSGKWVPGIRIVNANRKTINPINLTIVNVPEVSDGKSILSSNPKYDVLMSGSPSFKTTLIDPSPNAFYQYILNEEIVKGSVVTIGE